MKKTKLLLLAAAAMLLAAAPQSSGTEFKMGVWTVKMANVDANLKTGDFSTSSEVHMTRNGGDVTADRADGNAKAQDFHLYGHVVVHDNDGNFGSLTGNSTSSSQNSGPATLTADAVHIQGNSKVYTASGHVHYVQNDSVVDADDGVLNDETHELNLKGNVRVVQGDRRIASDSLLYNTVSGMAHAEGSPVTMQFPGNINPHMATPKPIDIKNPLQHKPKPTPSP